MSWIRAHPYLSLFALAGVVLALIVGTTTQRRALEDGGPIISVSVENVTAPSLQQGDGTFTPPPSARPASGMTIEPQPVTPTSPAIVPPAAVPQATTPTAAEADSATSSDALSGVQPSASHKPDTSIGDSLLQEVYSLAPSGVSVYGSPNVAQNRTPQQQALYDYGNKAGLVILSFDNANPAMGQALKDWYDHRTDASYQAPILAIAMSMDEAGAALESLSGVPAGAANDNTALAESFQAAAAQLRDVLAHGGSDSALADSMKQYDATADVFTKNYLAIADLFTRNDVTFASTDTGSAFSFASAGGL